MPVCPTCGQSLDAAARFCPKDGTTIRADTAPHAKVTPTAAGIDPARNGAAGSIVSSAPPPPPVTPPASTSPPSPPASHAAASPSLFERSEVGRPTRPLARPNAHVLAEAAKLTDPFVGAILDGRYRVRARLGQGGVGAVYEGEHVETKRAVAIKVLHAIFAGAGEFQKRFEREAQAASRLNHPACVSVIDFGRIERVEPPVAGNKLHGMPYLVMEFVRGKSLAERLDQPMMPGEAVLVARGVASALKHAHALGIVHRDIKPANVMLVEGGGTGLIVKLLDFGLAKVIDEQEGSSSEPLTQAGMVFGTPGYLSPEQAAGGAADARSDLYALGIMLYEMVAGRRPFLRPDPLEVVRDHLQTLPPPPRSFGAQISDALEGVIMRALAKDPKLRWQTADDFSRALGEVPELSNAPLTPSQPLQSPALAATMAAPAFTPAPMRAPTATPRWKTLLAEVEPRAKQAWSRVRAETERGIAWATPRAQKLIDRVRRERRAQLIAGGSALALLLLVILVARHPSAPPPPIEPVAAPPAEPVLAPSESGRRHLANAVQYQRKLWCSDALEELDRALRDDEQLRGDDTLQRTAIACLTPKTRDKAIHFLVDRVGGPARAALLQAASADPNGEVRRGAERVLERLPAPPAPVH